MNVSSPTVSFRLHESYFKRLETAAYEANSGSSHDEARRRLIQSLENESRDGDLRERMIRMEEDLSILKHNLHIATRAILIAATGPKAALTPEQVDAWAKEYFKPESQE